MTIAAAQTDVVLVDDPATRSAPTATDGAFWAYFAAKGPTNVAVTCDNLGDVLDTFGAEVSYSPLYFYARCYFALGGTRLTLARVVGPSPVLAGHTFNDSSAAATMRLAAIYPGDYYNGWRVTITTHAENSAIASGSFRILVVDSATGDTIAQSDDLATVTDAVLWSQTQPFRITDDATSANDPAAVVSAALTGGTDDHTNAVDANWQTAIDLFRPDLGPGQVALPGRTTDAAHAILFAHAASVANRWAVADEPDTPTVSTLTASGDAIAATTNGKHGEAYWPWALATSDTPGSFRAIPYSVVQCAMLSRADANGVARSQPPAGKDFGIIGSPIVGLSQPTLNQDDYDLLEAHGISVAKIVDGQVATWSNRTCDQSGDARWQSSSGMRVLMAMIAEFNVVGVRWEHKRLDGHRHAIATFGSNLTKVCKDHYDIDDLFGNTPREAYAVAVDEAVNTLASIQQKKLKGVAELRISDTVNTVRVEIHRRLLTEVL